MYEYVVLAILTMGQREFENVYGPCSIVRREKGAVYVRTTKQCKVDESILDVVEDVKDGLVTRNESTLYAEKLKRVKAPEGCKLKTAKVNKKVLTQTITCER